MWPSATVPMRIMGLEPTQGRCTQKLQEIASVLLLFIVIINCANILIHPETEKYAMFQNLLCFSFLFGNYLLLFVLYLFSVS